MTHKMVDGVLTAMSTDELDHLQQEQATYLAEAPLRQWAQIRADRDTLLQDSDRYVMRHQRELALVDHGTRTATTLTQAQYLELEAWRDALCTITDPKDASGHPTADPDTVTLPVRPSFLTS